MIKTFLITICFCTSVLANDIYVEQTSNDKPSEQNKPAFIEQKPASSEKELISNTSNQTYCSVIAGCINSQ